MSCRAFQALKNVDQRKRPAVFGAKWRQQQVDMVRHDYGGVQTYPRYTCGAGNRLRQASITTQLLAWKRLENQRALVDRWNGQLPQTVLGDKTSLLMPLPGEQK